MTGIAIIGCGFVADQYMRSLRFHPQLTVTGAHDRDVDRATRFGACHGVPQYATLDALLSDARVQIVLNLTNPRSHYEVSEKALCAGKHVYSEKPLAMDFTQAKQLVSLAAERRRWISSAPCTLLGETAQTIWRVLREGRLGEVRLVYAEMDDGMVHQMPYDTWVSESGAPWPYKDEFEVGCTIEHAGYYLTWLPAFFGPVTSMTAWASLQVPDKSKGTRLSTASPDFSVACMGFASGVAARLTCSVVAPHDHRLKIVGDEGVLSTHDSWMFRSPVVMRRAMRIRRRQFLSPWGRRYPLLGGHNAKIPVRGAAQIDWCRGVADMADAIRESRRPRLSPDFCLHVTELALGMHNAALRPGVVPITTSFDPIDPMPWAR